MTARSGTYAAARSSGRRCTYAPLRAGAGGRGVEALQHLNDGLRISVFEAKHLRLCLVSLVELLRLHHHARHGADDGLEVDQKQALIELHDAAHALLRRHGRQSRPPEKQRLRVPDRNDARHALALPAGTVQDDAVVDPASERAGIRTAAPGADDGVDLVPCGPERNESQVERHENCAIGFESIALRDVMLHVGRNDATADLRSLRLPHDHLVGFALHALEELGDLRSGFDDDRVFVLRKGGGG